MPSGGPRPESPTTLGAIFCAELGDVSRFGSAKQVCSWAGLTPRHRESDTTVHRGSITKQGPPLVRWAAIEAVSTNHGDDPIKDLYRRVAERRGRNKGRVAAVRKVLTLVMYIIPPRQSSYAGGKPGRVSGHHLQSGGYPVTRYADLRFYAELCDFLSSDRRSGMVTRSFDVAGSVKDMIEACGVPHTEVEVILANGVAVDFSYQVQDGDRISVYPPFQDFDVEPRWRVSPEPLPAPRFVLDGHLGKLASYLRLLGLDSAYDVEWTDPELVAISTREDRALLTRDRDLLMHGMLTRGYFVRATDPREQMTEVACRFDLVSSLDAFTRCMACNGELRVVDKEEIVDRLLPRTRQHYDEFRRCTDCERIYWKGSHHAQLQEIVDRVKVALTPQQPP